MPRESSLRTEGQFCKCLNRVMKDKRKRSRREIAILIKEIRIMNEETEGNTFTYSCLLESSRSKNSSQNIPWSVASPDMPIDHSH